MTPLTYRAPEKIKSFADKAAAAWNDILSGLVELRLAFGPPQILVQFGKIDRSKHPDRIGECRHAGPDSWILVLADDRKWALSWWDRLIGDGENVTACLLHEFGHVFKLPHASDPTYVMHPNMTGSVKMSVREKEQYRVHFMWANPE